MIAQIRTAKVTVSELLGDDFLLLSGSGNSSSYRLSSDANCNLLNNLVSRLKLILTSKLNLNFGQSRYFSVMIKSLQQIVLEVSVFCSNW